MGGESGDELCGEAIRLARLLALLMPDEPEVAGLLALLLLTESRRRARFASDRSLVLLRDQDCGRWDRSLIDERQAIVRACLRRNQPGPYQLQAALNAVHADADSVESTHWSQIIALYDQLLAVVASSPRSLGCSRFLPANPADSARDKAVASPAFASRFAAVPSTNCQPEA